MPRLNSGYSLYELLMTLTLAAIIIGLGLPSFAGITARNRQHAEINVVSLCPSIDAISCNPGRDWSTGWLMFANHDADEPPRIDAGEPLLQAHTVGENVKITANRRGFTLRATQKRATNGTFVVCDTAGRIAPKALVVSYTGRPRVTLKTTRGDPYACAD